MGKGRPPSRKSPEEKKALSYAKDGRNAYGENNKASRKLIPKRKAEESRDSRRKTSQTLALLPKMAEETAAVAESSVRKDLFRVGGWKKEPDLPLGDKLELQRKKAIVRIGRKQNARRQVASEGMQSSSWPGPRRTTP